MKKKVSSVTQIFGLALLSSAVVAEPTAESPASAADNTKAPEVVSSSTRMVFIDPDTGKMVSNPNAEQMTEMLESTARAKRGVASEPKVMKDGSLMIEFNGQFTNSINATIDENGEIITSHGEHQEGSKVAQ